MRFALACALVLAVVACTKTDSSNPAQPSSAAPVAKSAVTLVVSCSSEKKDWMKEAVQAFSQTQPKTPSGAGIRVDLRVAGSGEAADDIVAGRLKAHVFAPASTAYLTLLNRSWRQAMNAKVLAPNGEPLLLSPIVIAMWKPMAQALGWPSKDIGWADIVKVSKNPKGWAAYKHPEWGAFKLGHTHPEYSNSGLLAVLAEAYASTSKKRDLNQTDLAAPKTKKMIGSVEDAIVHYGKSTGLFADKMLERGPAYMSAAVLYENLVIESYGKQSAMPLVAIYPVEGTFWSDHPFAILDADWVGPEEKAAAKALLAFLKAKPQQQRALELGFRPGDPSIAVNAPIDAAHGVDAKQPQTLLDVPDGDTLAFLLSVWRELKKSAEVVILFDRSGSMHGRPLAEAQAGAQAFLDGLDDRDAASMVFFNHIVGEVQEPQPLAKSRAALKEAIANTFAEGRTALYDGIAKSYDVLLERARKQPARIHALVVMTDGKDEGSLMLLEQLRQRFSSESAPVKIFTIAYGDGADSSVLDSIASSAQGTSVRGNSETIVQVYRDLSAFF